MFFIDTAKQLNDESSCEKGSPSEQQTLEDLSDYEVIPEYDLKEQPSHLSESKENQYNGTIDANDHTVVYVSLAKRETTQQPPVYASLNFNTEQNESQRSVFQSSHVCDFLANLSVVELAHRHVIPGA